MWTRSKTDDDYARAFPEWWEIDVAAMVDKDFNHPCVIVYSTGNEILDIGTPAGDEWAHRIAEAIRSRDASRFVTNGIQALFAVRDDLAELFGRAAADVDPEAGVNTQLTELFDQLALVMRNPEVGDRIAPACATLDVAGYNYLESRYDVDHELHPHRVIVGSENHPPVIDRNWQYVTTHDHVIGDFTWTGWDYLGEAGIGRIVWADDATDQPGFHGPYPWIAAWCGDIDITGHRRPASHYREIVFGLTDAPYIAVERPGHVGQTPAMAGPWSWSDTVASWTWPDHEHDPVRVEVYSAADEVELVVNGRVAGRVPTGPDHRYRGEIVTAYEPGELTAIAYTAGTETSRTTLRTARGPARLAVVADRSTISADGGDLVYLDITLVDEAGTVDSSADRAVTVTISGPGVLQGYGSANPRTEEPFTGDTHTTFEGRALAVVRATAAGTITVTAAAEGCAPCTATVTAR
jgi:beta-galactosidase